MNVFKEVAAKKYKMAVWSMALGIIAVCSALVCPGLVSFVCGLLAIIFAIAAKKDYFTVETSTPSTIGLVTGITAVTLAVLMVVVPVLLAIIAVVGYIVLYIIANLPAIIRALR